MKEKNIIDRIKEHQAIKAKELIDRAKESFQKDQEEISKNIVE